MSSRMGGVVTAIVVSAPDSMGRIQLRFPWLPDGDALDAVWAPVATPLAGDARGLWLMPEIGDEVLVAYERGDIDRPFVVGFLWNGVQAPPESDANNRVLVTPGGHTLRFEDGPDKKVVLRSAGGHEITLDDVSGRISLQEATGASSVVLDPTAVTLSGGGHRVTLSAAGVAIT